MLKRVVLVVGALSLLGGYFMHTRQQAPRAEPTRPSDGAAHDAAFARSGTTPAKATMQDQDVADLRGALLRAALTAPREPEPSSAFAAASARQALLDRRMTAAPANSELTAHLQQALDGAFPSDMTHSLTCGGAMCRVDLSGGVALDQTVEALVDKLPKLFAASAVLATDDTRRAIFVTTDPSLLRVAPPSASQVASPPR